MGLFLIADSSIIVFYNGDFPMKDLVQELLAPSYNADGTMVPVSTVKRRAAEAIVQLTNLQQQDLHGRLLLQAQYAEAVQQLVDIQGPPIEYCVAEYREICNQEYERAFS